MKTNKRKWLALVVALFIMGGLIFIPGQAMAKTTQGDIAFKLAGLLGLDVRSKDAVIALTEWVGIVPSGGWDTTALAQPTFISALFTSVDNAIAKGKISPSPALGNASTLVAAACTAAGMPSAIVVNAIVKAGGDKVNASTGASYGASIAAGVLTVGKGLVPLTGGPSGGGAGGGGGVGTQSR
ncbi:MAG: hypothetical protein U9P49_07945 [Thermodesulfobacteriota bacterium]|nr:hypothetical protein [Thermodesulfobacteriota bacterium]